MIHLKDRKKPDKLIKSLFLQGSQRMIRLIDTVGKLRTRLSLIFQTKEKSIRECSHRKNTKMIY
jgi:hypothetical protein